MLRPVKARLAQIFDRFCDTAPFFRSARAQRIVSLVWLAMAGIGLVVVTGDLRGAPAPPPLEMGSDGDAQRWGLSLETRQTMFREVAALDPEWRKKAASRFGELWRREDDRAASERDHVRGMAGRYHVSVTVAYLVVDEGIRLKWTVLGGAPLSASVVPLQKK